MSNVRELRQSLLSSLTSSMDGDKKSLSIPKEVLKMMGLVGSAQEYRPGKFRVVIPSKGKRLDIYTNEHGKRFNCLADAQETLIYINGLIKNKKFFPSEWKGNHGFGIKPAIET
jgi:hypothetical protein